MMLRLAAIAGLICALPVAGATEPPELERNPFARPPSERTLPETRPTGDKDNAAGLVLTATMVAGRDRLANVGGRVIRPGDEIQGYSLLKVFEDRAVFDKNGKRLTIYVKPELVDEDE